MDLQMLIDLFGQKCPDVFQWACYAYKVGMGIVLGVGLVFCGGLAVLIYKDISQWRF